MIVGKPVAWGDVLDEGGMARFVSFRGLVLDSQVSDGSYHLLVQPKQMMDEDSGAWCDVTARENTLQTVLASRCRVLEVDEGALPGEGYRAPASVGDGDQP
jgi:hypothetical protein